MSAGPVQSGGAATCVSVDVSVFSEPFEVLAQPTASEGLTRGYPLLGRSGTLDTESQFRTEEPENDRELPRPFDLKAVDVADLR